MPSYEGPQFPPQLSSRQQDCAEPLLIIADLIGGEWPQRARDALISAFALSAFEDFYSSKQVLGDIQNAFLAKDHPEWISSKDLLEFLHTLDDRTWDEWSKGKPMNSKDLAALLAPFGIKSKNHRTGEDDKVAKGYNRQDFLTNWQKYLPETCGTAAPGCGEDTQGAHMSVAADLQNSSGQPDADPRSEPTAPVGKITTVIAGEQFSVEAAEYQKRRYSDPLREASMRAIEKALNQ